MAVWYFVVNRFFSYYKIHYHIISFRSLHKNRLVIAAAIEHLLFLYSHGLSASYLDWYYTYFLITWAKRALRFYNMVRALPCYLFIASHFIMRLLSANSTSCCVSFNNHMCMMLISSKCLRGLYCSTNYDILISSVMCVVMAFIVFLLLS